MQGSGVLTASGTTRSTQPAVCGGAGEAVRKDLPNSESNDFSALTASTERSRSIACGAKRRMTSGRLGRRGKCRQAGWAHDMIRLMGQMAWHAASWRRPPLPRPPCGRGS